VRYVHDAPKAVHNNGDSGYSSLLTGGNLMSIAKVMPGAPILATGSFALSGTVQAIKVLYGIAVDINDFIDEHIEKLKASESPLVASTGRVLEAAKFGFGVGYMGSVAIIAVGQYLLGFTFAAVTTVATAAALTNPIAMTCGALGAIYYGWNALTDKERAQILERLSEGLSMGIELIRSLVEFVIRKSKDLMTSSQLDDVKEFVKTQAARFGRSLYDITGKVGDAVKVGMGRASELLGQAGDAVGGAVKGGMDRAGGLLGQAGSAVGDGARDAYDSTTEAGGRLVKTIKKTFVQLADQSIVSSGSFVPSNLRDPERDLSPTRPKRTRAPRKAKR
jgi:hypothetical protein